MVDDTAIHPTELAEATPFGDEPTLMSQDPAPEPAGGRRLPRGATIGRYVVLDVVGQGGMGVVYAAYDPQLDRRIAIKLLRPSRASGTRGRARLLREAQAIARISHPNVIAVHDVGAHDESVFVAMEFVPGETLARWLERTRPSPEAFVEMMLQVGRGLAAAHAAGIVHRDFKPDNVLVGADGRGRVLDFGLARGQEATDSVEFDAASASGSLGRWSQLDNDLTAEGAVMGTPAYMAPEQHVGQRSTPATDQFAFCIVLYQGLYGHRPFEGGSARDLAKATIKGKVRPPPRGTKVPTHLLDIVTKGLSPRAEDRFPSMTALLRELARDRRTRWRRTFAGIGAVAVVTTVAGVSYVSGARREVDPCVDAAAAADPVWNDRRRSTIATAFAASGVEGGPSAWARAQGSIDGWVDGWRDAQHGACVATRVRATQSEHLLDRRTACLSRRLSHLDALLESFAQPDARLVEHVVRIAHELPDLSTCADMETIVEGVAPPASARVQQRVDEAELAMARASARAQTGRYAEVVERLQPWLAEAERLGYLPLVARLRLDLGNALRALDDPAGLAQLEQAFVDGLEAGDDRIVMMAGIDVAQAIGDHDRRTDEALRVLDVVDAVIRRAQPPDVAIPMGAANARAVIFVRVGRWDEAGALFRRSVELQEADDPHHPNMVVALQNLGGFYAERSKLELAAELHERARTLALELYGPDHSSLRDLYQNLGLIALLRQDYAQAERWLEHALRIQRRVFAGGHPDIARTLGALGIVARHRNALEESERLQREALAMLRGRLGTPHPLVAECLQHLATVVSYRGRHEEAMGLAQEALTIAQDRLGPNDPGVATAHEGLAAVLAESGRYEGALEHADRALAIFGELGGDDEPKGLSALRTRGAALRGLGRFADARVVHEQAVEVASRASAGELALARFQLAKTLAAGDAADRPRAVALARQAQATFHDPAIDAATVDAIAAFLAEHDPP